MTVPKNEIRYYKPAPYTRDPAADAKVRRVYHPLRHPTHPLRLLAEEGEAVIVRPGESLHWDKLERTGDVIRQKSDPSKAKAKDSKDKKG